MLDSAYWHHWTAVRGKWHLGCMLSYSCGGCGGPSHWNSPGISELTFFFKKSYLFIIDFIHLEIETEFSSHGSFL